MDAMDWLGPWFLTTVFVSAFIFFHLAMAGAHRLNLLTGRFVRSIEYIWLACAFFSLVAGAEQVRGTVARAQLAAHQEVMEVRRRLLHEIAKGDYGSCTPRIKSDVSPPNFDDIYDQQREACAFVRVISSKVTAINISSEVPASVLEDVVNASFPLVVGFDERNDTLRKEILYWNEQVRRGVSIEKEARPRVWEGDILAVMFPSAAMIALALRMSKVFADALNASAKE